MSDRFSLKKAGKCINELKGEIDSLKETNASLVEALEMILAISGGVEVGDVVYNKAVKALNKAKGE